jgi:hypothetical protein
MHVSRTFPRTVDGLRVAVAGLPDSMPVKLGEGVELTAVVIGDLRALSELPHRLEVVIPYRIEADSAVEVNRSELVSEY